MAGERIGYLAISPKIPQADALFNACTFTNRALGYINAPAICNSWSPKRRKSTPTWSLTRKKRGHSLRRTGRNSGMPSASLKEPSTSSFKTPIPDDMAFSRILKDEGVLAVPGTGFAAAATSASR